jgi:CheY-like chemotaxis protein
MRNDPSLIMLVEDNADHAELVMRNLAQHAAPNTVLHVSDGQAALDYLFRSGAYADPALSPRPNLILLDLRLPKVDGLEVLRRLKDSETLRQIPVVVLTTSDAERDIVRAYQHHANSYVVKPVGFEQFQQLIEGLGAYWLARNIHPPL